MMKYFVDSLFLLFAIDLLISHITGYVAADKGDSGVYICTANGVSATFTLSIEGPPSDGTYITHPMH